MILSVHPLASRLPLLPDDELQRLADDIGSNGLHHPILLYGGEVLDGRNRLRACELAGVKPAFATWAGTFAAARALVWSQNVLRRHLPKDQQAAIWVGLSEVEDSHQAEVRDRASAEAKGRQRLGGASAGRGRPKQVVQPVAQPIDRKARAAEARAAGVSHETLRRIRQLPPEQRESIAAGEVSLADVRRDHRLAERAERNATLVGRNAELPPEQRRYAVIYADPPWQYEHAVSNSRAVENHYPTMDLEAICALPVARLSAVDAVLFMWATSPKVAEACRVVDAWGFRYVTCAVWDKGRIEMGYYFRQQHELLFVATRGNPGTPAPGDRTSSVLSYPRRRHSEKPTEVYELLERMYPDVARIELFARAKRPGWERWGNQA